jgi:hypothetical protein
MTVYEIPLIAAPQTLRVSLVGVLYDLTVYWCWPAQCWMFDLAIDSTGVYILRGAPLVTGVDLLAQFIYLGIGGALIVQTDNAPLAAPTFANLGQTAHFYFIPWVQ